MFHRLYANILCASCIRQRLNLHLQLNTHSHTHPQTTDTTNLHSAIYNIMRIIYISYIMDGRRGLRTLPPTYNIIKYFTPSSPTHNNIHTPECNACKSLANTYSHIYTYMLYPTIDENLNLHLRIRNMVSLGFSERKICALGSTCSQNGSVHNTATNAHMMVWHRVCRLRNQTSCF